MIDQLEVLAGILEDATGANVIVTAGRPAAPSYEGRECQTVVYVWGQVVADLNQDDPTACLVRSRFSMFYEIQTCYPEGWEDQVGSQAAEDAAVALYGLMASAWCGLVVAKDAGEFCDDCKFVELAPLEVQPRLGGAVSALGGVTIPYVCDPLEDSPTSP